MIAALSSVATNLQNFCKCRKNMEPPVMASSIVTTRNNLIGGPRIQTGRSEERGWLTMFKNAEVARRIYDRRLEEEMGEFTESLPFF